MNVTRARRIAAKHLPDRCAITIDPEGARATILDPDTLQLVTAPGASRHLWSGPCRVGHDTRTGSSTSEDQAGQDLYTDRRQLRLPHDAVVAIGAVVKITRSDGDQLLEGSEWTVIDVIVASSRASRIAKMVRRERGPRT